MPQLCSSVNKKFNNSYPKLTSTEVCNFSALYQQIKQFYHHNFNILTHLKNEVILRHYISSRPKYFSTWIGKTPENLCLMLCNRICVRTSVKILRPPWVCTQKHRGIPVWRKLNIYAVYIRALLLIYLRVICDIQILEMFAAWFTCESVR